MRRRGLLLGLLCAPAATALALALARSDVEASATFEPLLDAQLARMMNDQVNLLSEVIARIGLPAGFWSEATIHAATDISQASGYQLISRLMQIEKGGRIAPPAPL